MAIILRDHLLEILNCVFYCIKCKKIDFSLLNIYVFKGVNNHCYMNTKEKLLKIEQLLIKEGHELNEYSYPEEYVGYSEYFIKNHGVDYIWIELYNTIIRLKISSPPSYIKECVGRGYDMDEPYAFNDPICGNKRFQSFEDLLDELQELRLINYGHNIKGSTPAD